MRFPNCIAVTALLACPPVAAQSPTPEPITLPSSEEKNNDEIIVEAPPTVTERRRELRKMVTSLFRNPRREMTIASFGLPVCPKVFGLPDDAALAISARMKENARSMGVRTAKSDKCRHNISVIFVPPSEGPAKTWLDEDSEPLKHLLMWQRMNVLKEHGPVRAWNHEAVRSDEGLLIPNRTGVPIDETLAMNQIWMASRISLPISMEISGAAVLIELEAANGKTIEQLGDYATMRTLANIGGIDPETVPAAPTILTLFQDDEPPEELTTFDRALISKLYSMRGNARKKRFYSNIAGKAVAMEMDENTQASDR